MIKTIDNIDLIKDILNYDVILVGTNIYGQLSNGFQRKVRKLYPHVHEANIKTKYGDPAKLGTIVPVEGTPMFILCYICKGYNFRPDLQKEFLEYDALEKCLKKLNKTFKDKRIASTYLGTSRFDGNGDLNKVINLFEKCCPDLDLTIYTYFQKSYHEEAKEEWDYLKEVKKSDIDQYYKLCKKRHEDRKNKTKTEGWI